MHMKKIQLLALLVLATAAAVAQSSEVFIKNGKAIGGYDPVAFFKSAKPVMGYDSIKFRYQAADWHFSSEDNKKAFAADPEKYAPQYGGYCAYGTAEGHKAPTEAGTWTIVDNKLYFNYSEKVKQGWLKNQPALIKKADQQWPTVKIQP